MMPSTGSTAQPMRTPPTVSQTGSHPRQPLPPGPSQTPLGLPTPPIIVTIPLGIDDEVEDVEDNSLDRTQSPRRERQPQQPPQPQIPQPVPKLPEQPQQTLATPSAQLPPAQTPKGMKHEREQEVATPEQAPKAQKHKSNADEPTPQQPSAPAASSGEPSSPLARHSTAHDFQQPTSDAIPTIAMSAR